MSHLAPLDATFLELEDADPGAHMHIGALMLFDGEPPFIEELLVHVDDRLDGLPAFRSRLSSARVGHIVWPSWVDDEDFDLRAHVRQAALPAPGGERELLDWAADFYAHRLDRGRPLWEIVLVTGLEERGWALALKAHHCLVDGMGAVALTGTLLDGDPTTTTPLPGAPSALTSLVRGGADLTLHPGHARRGLSEVRALAELVLRDELVGAPATSINAPIGKLRRLAALDVELDELRAIRARLGGTINDAVLALATGGLRRLLTERGEKLPPRGLRAMVPVSLRPAGPTPASGNQVSSLFVELPVAEPDAFARHAVIREATAHRKAAGQAQAGSAVVALGNLAPPVVHSALARALFGARLFNITVTNVRGSSVPQSALGCTMRRAIPLVPLASDHALGIAVLSYAGNVCFGLQADRALVPDLDNVVVGMAAERDALLAAPAVTSAAR